MLLPSGGSEEKALYQARDAAALNEAASGYGGALEYYKDLRGGASPQKVQRIREAVEEHKNPKSLDLDWSNEGPVNQGGRTRSIMTLNGGSQMWVGSVSGGLWRSYDRGENWEPISAFNQYCIVSSMAQTGDGKVYVATGSTHESPNGTGSSGFMGRGLYVTSDKGGSFDLVSGTLPDTNNTGSPWAFINEIEADPTNNTGLWIARSGGLVYYDANAGTINNVSGVFGAAEGLDVSKDGSHILVSNASGQVFLSTDGGNTFTDLSTGLGSPLPKATGRVEVAIAPSNEDYMYVSTAQGSPSKLSGIYMSKDGGSSWGEIAGEGSGAFRPFYNGLSHQGNYDQAIAVDPQNPNRIVLGGVSLWEYKNMPTQFNPYAGQWSKLATTNGFPATVPYYVHADVHTFEWVNSQRLYVGTDGGVFLTKDGLQTFVPASENFVSTQFYSVEMSPNDQILGGTQDNGTQYLNRANEWAHATRIRGGDGFDCEISHMDPSVIFSTIYGNLGNSPYITRSTDGGPGMTHFLNSTDLTNLVDDFYANIALYEDRNDTLSKDSVVYVNTTADSSTIYQGDSISYESMTLRKEINTTLKVDSLGYGDSVMVHDPVQSLFAFTASKNNNAYVYLTRDALRLTKTSVTAHQVLDLGSTPLNSPGTETVNTYAFSGDGNYLWVGMRNGSVYRISGLDSAYGNNAFQNKVSSQQIITGGGVICTDISVDDNDPDHVVVSYGRYGGNQKVRQSFDATSSNPSFTNIWNSSTTNLSAPLAQMPVYSVLIETDDPNIILVGTEHGLFATDDGGNTWVHQNSAPLGHVPIFAIEQQDRDWDQGAKNPHHIYLGSHGRGFFKTDDLESLKPRKELEAGERANATLKLFPNPASEETFLSVSDLPEKELQLAIYDLQGRMVRDLGSRQVDGSERIRLKLSDMKEGIYVVRARAPEFDRTSKLIISR